MSDNEEWGEWILHDGKGCPIHDGVMMEGVWERPERFDIFADVRLNDASWGSWDWSLFGKRDPSDGRIWMRIIRYRIRKPRGLTILENLIADLPAPVQPKVNA